jgi:hypothetical protein
MVIRSLTRHRADEFPAGYSLASCSPAELASASPDEIILLDAELEVLEDSIEREGVFISRVSP